MSRSKKIILLVSLIIGISLLHYFTSASLRLQHAVYREVYFLPIFLAGFWFGLKGALAASLGITVIFVPFLIFSWTNFSIISFNSLLEILVFNMVAAIMGRLVDRQKAESLRLREAESLAAIGGALAALAHDIRAPLVAIGGFTGLVLKKMAPGDPNREKLDIVTHETERLERMVSEILDFSRPVNLRLKTGSINETISHCMAIVTVAAEAKGIRLEGSYSEDLPEISFDNGRIEQVLINLLMNAIQASPERQSVTIATLRRARYILISIKDFGCGIPGETREKIFVPFFTTKREGTGLGLAIAKKIIDAHGGIIEFESNDPEGCTFSILLPMKR